MNGKTLLGAVVILAIAGGAYWFYTDSQKDGTARQQGTAVTDTTPAPQQAKMSAEAGRVVGKWKSADDAKFTREFREDGTVTDSYEGDASATSNGRWSQVVDVAAEPIELPAVGGATLLKLVFGNETYYFAVSADTTAEKLVLIHLSGRGNVLTFTRI